MEKACLSYDRPLHIPLQIVCPRNPDNIYPARVRGDAGWASSKNEVMIIIFGRLDRKNVGRDGAHRH